MQTILVCDDDKQIVDAIDIYLTGEGFQVIKAYDGYEALEILEKQKNGQLISYSEFCSANSYCGWLDMCNGNRLKEKYIVPIVPSLIRYYEEVIAAGKKNKAAKIRKFKKKLEKKGLVKAA